jgi:hypothetical protein
MNKKLGFTHGFVYDKDRLYMGAVDVDLEEEDVYHGYVLRWQAGQWGNWSISHRIYALGVYDTPKGRTSMVMAPDGQVQIGDADGFRWEDVDPHGDGPSERRPLTCLRQIGQHVFAVGMSRMGYRRPLAGGPWERIDAGLRVSHDSTEITGLLAVDGFDENDIYAVGFHGQMWHFDGRWHPVQSLTNLKLECVRCASDGRVYVAGSHGVLLRGRGATWEIIPQEATEETFWGMEHAFGKLHLSTANGHLYRLDDGDEVVEVDLGLGEAVTTRSLHFNDGLLLSTGAYDLCVFDGQGWTRLAVPAA